MSENSLFDDQKDKAGQDQIDTQSSQNENEVATRGLPDDDKTTCEEVDYQQNILRELTKEEKLILENRVEQMLLETIESQENKLIYKKRIQENLIKIIRIKIKENQLRENRPGRKNKKSKILKPFFYEIGRFLSLYSPQSKSIFKRLNNKNVFEIAKQSGVTEPLLLKLLNLTNQQIPPEEKKKHILYREKAIKLLIQFIKELHTSS